MQENLNIADLIEKNSITRLSKNYENSFLIKIKENFNENQQQLFVASFYCFLSIFSKMERGFRIVAVLKEEITFDVF